MNGVRVAEAAVAAVVVDGTHVDVADTEAETHVTQDVTQDKALRAEINASV